MKSVYSVSQVNQYIKNLFMSDYALSNIYIKGEVSNCKYHSSGHIYFTLKDRGGVIGCVMFASSRRGLKFQMEEGQQVIALGNISVYERDGKYQLYVKEIILDGLGLLYQKFEELKAELERAGYFKQELKKPLPLYPEKIGIVTAKTGAAIQDILNIAARRNPYIQLVLFAAQVQGEGSAQSVIRGIKALEAYGVDVMIVGRGGGSIEDLWAFNEAQVADAIYQCKVPVISAVGHETDITIADFVADLRAPTPSAAAELAIPDYMAVTGRLYEYHFKLDTSIGRIIDLYRNKLDMAGMKLEHLSPSNQINEKFQYLSGLEDALKAAMDKRLAENKYRLAILGERLNGVSPHKKLSQGYSYLTDQNKLPVKSIKSISKEDVVFISLIDGDIEASVKETYEQRSRKYGEGKDFGGGI